MNARYRPALIALAAIAAVWLMAWAAYGMFEHFKVTAEKLRAYLEQRDLNSLSADARAKALHDLARKINALSPDERNRARMDHLWDKWFAEMTEGEKGDFLDATLPSGFQQMLTSFEEQPADRRQRAIDGAIQRLRQQRANPASQTNQVAASTNAPVLSPELQQKVAMLGLKSVYGNSSAEAKAELAPLLEEIQKDMESGRMFRGGAPR